MMMVGLMLTMMLGMQAQTKVAPKMAKGMTKVYVTESKIAIPGQPEVNMTLETKYAVTGETKDGYKMEVLTTDFQSDAKESNVAALMLSAAQKMLKGMTLRGRIIQAGAHAESADGEGCAEEPDYERRDEGGLAEEHAEHNQPDDAER